MKTRLHTLFATVLITSLPVIATAGDRYATKQTFTDHAKVIQVTPRFRTVTKKIPRRNCEAPARRHRHHQLSQHNTPRRQHQPEAIFAGGVIGGVIGHELSRGINGRSNAGATLAGAIIGAGLASAHNDQGANRHARPHNLTTVQHGHGAPRNQFRHHRNNARQRCTTTIHEHQTREADGYTVTYRYRGRIFETHTQRYPGDKIPVRISISAR